MLQDGTRATPAAHRPTLARGDAKAHSHAERFDPPPPEASADNLDDVLNDVEDVAHGIDVILRQASVSALGPVLALNTATPDAQLDDTHAADATGTQQDEPLQIFDEEHADDLRTIDALLAQEAEHALHEAFESPADAAIGNADDLASSDPPAHLEGMTEPPIDRSNPSLVTAEVEPGPARASDVAMSTGHPTAVTVSGAIAIAESHPAPVRTGVMSRALGNLPAPAMSSPRSVPPEAARRNLLELPLRALSGPLRALSPTAHSAMSAFAFTLALWALAAWLGAPYLADLRRARAHAGIVAPAHEQSTLKADDHNAPQASSPGHSAKGKTSAKSSSGH